MTGGLDYDLVVQVYFGLVVCAFSAGHAFAILSAIRSFIKRDPRPVLMTETSVLCDTLKDSNGDGSVDHTGYFEDDYDQSLEGQACYASEGPDEPCGRDDARELILGQRGANDDPSGPEANQCNETRV